MNAPGRHPLVISVHGIRTRGRWQRDLAIHIQRAGFEYVLPDYGYFGLVAFLWPWARAAKVKWFLGEYSRLTENGAGPPPSVIAHSMGTYIVASAMEQCPEIRFDRIILCGSIVRKSYSWSNRLDAGQFNWLLNDRGKRDLWARAAEWVVQDAGPSGYSGFDDPARGRVVEEVHQSFRHSDFFYDLNYTKQWIPFLQGKQLQPLAQEDRRPINWKFLVFIAVASLALGTIMYVAVNWYRCHDWATDPAPGPLAEMPAVLKSNVPPRADVLRTPATPARNVRLKIVNDSGHTLLIMLYACEKYYEPNASISSGWSSYYLRDGESEAVPELVRDHGWYLVYAKRKCDREPGFLEADDLYGGEYPILTLRPGSSGRPAVVDLQFGPGGGK